MSDGRVPCPLGGEPAAKRARGSTPALSDAELEHYRENGFVIPEGFKLAPAVIERVKADHARLVAAHPEFADYCSALLPHDLSFLNLAREPAIVKMVSQVLGRLRCRQPPRRECRPGGLQSK